MIRLQDPLLNSPLGKTTQYEETYAPHLLCSIPREANRKALGILGELPFKGGDIWNAYELSWLNQKGKPCVALGEFIVPCCSPYLFESKSFKLYLLSFAQTRYESVDEVAHVLSNDLLKATGEIVQIKLTLVDECHDVTIQGLMGSSLDDQDLEFDTYEINPKFLKIGTEDVSEMLYSNLLKSNCLVTGQPDWGSVQICYTGKQIDRAGLLKYIVSFRTHSGFAEHCVEQIFVDVMRYCVPQRLSVYARYTRRGGLDINPYRSTENHFPNNARLCRQ